MYQIREGETSEARRGGRWMKAVRALSVLVSLLVAAAYGALAQTTAPAASEGVNPARPATWEEGSNSEFVQQQRQQLQTRYQKQLEDNKAFLGTLQGKSVKEKCQALLGHFAGQYNENVAFNKEQFEQRIQFVKEKLAARSVAPEKQASILEGMNRRRERVNRMYEEMYQKFVTGLTDLAGKPGATDDQVGELVHSYREAMRGGQDASRGESKPGEPPPAPPAVAPAAPAPAAPATPAPSK
jgi:hypothetical protein